MITFLIDADLPLSLLENLKALGYNDDDVRLIGMPSANDDQIFGHAVKNGYILLSGDKGFANVLRFPLGTHNGIVVARFPAGTHRNTKVQIITKWIPTLQESGFRGNLVILEAKGVRIRRHSTA